MAYSFPNGLKPKLLHTVVMRAFKMNKTQRNQNHSLEVVFECIWFFRHFGEVVSHSPDKNIQNPCLQPAMPHAREIFFHIWGRSTLEMCHICFCRQAQIPAHRIVGHLDMLWKPGRLIFSGKQCFNWFNGSEARIFRMFFGRRKKFGDSHGSMFEFEIFRYL